MLLGGIIAEFNPFHNGHKYLIEKAREDGCTHIVCVMSGNFVQRGDVAIASKWARAKAAVSGGADLIVELPTPFALSSAQDFARGGVSVLDSMSCVDRLYFGSECGELSLLFQTANAMGTEEYGELVQHFLQSGISYPAACEKAVNRIIGKDSKSVLRSPNDTLASSYICALKNASSRIEPKAVKRVASEHDRFGQYGNFASAAYIRQILLSKGFNGDAELLMPKESAEILKDEFSCGKAPCILEKLQTSILSKLRSMTAEDFKEIPGVSEGLHNRLYSKVRKATGIDSLIEEAETKRYTYSRIRRIVLLSYLSLTKDYVPESAPYIRVLALNERGREILKECKKKACVPIITKAASALRLEDGFAKRLFDKECEMTDKFFLSSPKIMPCGAELTEKIIGQK